MKSAEQWANEMQSALDGISLTAERRLLEQFARATQADALRHAAQLLKRKADLHSNPDLADCHLDDVAAIEAEAAKLEEAK